MTKHPAKFNTQLMSAIRAQLPRTGMTILDPFAGVGTVHELRPQHHTWGVEIEPEWATQSPYTIVGDSQALPFGNGCFDAVVTSPTYANRVNDNFESKDKSRRITYRHYIGRKLNPNNSGGMPWGNRYRELHRNVWAECTRVLRPDGLFLLNCKNHIRAGNEVDVTGWHVETLESLGYTELSRTYVKTPGHREGRNHSVRLDGEYIILFAAPN